MQGTETNVMLGAVLAMVEAGVAVHWLQRQSKKPVGNEWSSKPVHTLQSLRDSYVRGYNIGVRPGEFSKTESGYLHLIDMDIRDANQVAEAWALVLKHYPDARALPYVISGSGGESRHLYFFTDKPFKSMKLGHSEGFSMVFSAEFNREVKKYDWEVELFGAPKQAVLPPSIHPDTGKAYVWGREIDWEMVQMGLGPAIPSDIVAGWGVRETEFDLDTDDEDDDLLSIAKQAPMGLSEDEIDQIIADLPIEWVDDRDQWWLVGMALAHEYENSQLGFEKWSEWSMQSVKYNAKDQITVWKSFKGAKRPIRMATLIMAAGAARDQRERAEWVGDFDNDNVNLDDLLGSTDGGKSLVVVGVEPDSIDLDDLLGGGVTNGPKKAEIPTNGEEYDPEWETYLHRDEEGQVKSTSHNLELIVRNDIRTRGMIAFNQFTQEVVLIRDPKRRGNKRKQTKPVRQLDGAIWEIRDSVNGDLWTDSHDRSLRIMLEAPKSQGGYQIKVSDRDLVAAIDSVGHRQSFHPVRQFLKAQSWDKMHRVERMFIDYLGSPDDAYHREAAVLFMIGAVARVFEPGHKFDFVPIFEGLQGKRKSTFIKMLGRPWYSELSGDIHDRKAMVESMQGSWIIEIGELSAFRRADQETLKQFVATTEDKVRMSYDRRSKYFPRQCVFIGSTNGNAYLDDPTGGRRWWPVKCHVKGDIDTDKFLTIVHQYWAEAYEMYLEWRRRFPTEDLPLYLRNPESVNTSKRLQDSRRKERPDDVLLGQIEDWLDQPIAADFDDDDLSPLKYRNSICGLMIWQEMLKRDPNDFPAQQQQKISMALDRLEGWSDAIRENMVGSRYGRQRWRHRLINLGH